MSFGSKVIEKVVVSETSECEWEREWVKVVTLPSLNWRRRTHRSLPLRLPLVYFLSSQWFCFLGFVDTRGYFPFWIFQIKNICAFRFYSSFSICALLSSFLCTQVRKWATGCGWPILNIYNAIIIICKEYRIMGTRTI